jgi:hypothetical protein
VGIKQRKKVLTLLIGWLLTSSSSSTRAKCFGLDHLSLALGAQSADGADGVPFLAGWLPGFFRFFAWAQLRQELGAGESCLVGWLASSNAEEGVAVLLVLAAVEGLND